MPLLLALDIDDFTRAAWVRYTGVDNDKTGGRWEFLERADLYWVNIRTNGHVRVGGHFGGFSVSSPGVRQYLDSAWAAAG